MLVGACTSKRSEVLKMVAGSCPVGGDVQVEVLVFLLQFGRTLRDSWMVSGRRRLDYSLWT
jgi:hypothetical protein